MQCTKVKYKVLNELRKLELYTKKRKEQIIFVLQGQDNVLQGQDNVLLKKYKTRTQLQLYVQRMAKDRMLGAIINKKTRYKYSRETKKTRRWIKEDTANDKQKINDMKKISPIREWAVWRHNASTCLEEALYSCDNKFCNEIMTQTVLTVLHSTAVHKKVLYQRRSKRQSMKWCLDRNFCIIPNQDVDRTLLNRQHTSSHNSRHH